MTRYIPLRIVQVNERSVDNRYAFKYILQALANIMAISQGHAFIEHNIHLHIKFVTRVVGLATLDTVDCLGEAHGEVEEDVAVFRGGDSPCEVFDVQGAGFGPRVDYVEGEQKAT